MKKKTKTSPYEWALAQWARLCDEDATATDPDATREDSIDVGRDPDGEIVEPYAYLGARAEKFFAERGVNGRAWILRAFRAWVVSLMIAAALGAIVFPIARVDAILTDVNLAGGFVFFLLGQLLFLTFSIVLLVVTLFQSAARALLGKGRPETRGEKLVRGLSSLVGGAVLVVLRVVVPFVYRFFQRSKARFGKRDADSATDAPAPIDERSFGATFWNAFFSRPRFLFYWGGTLSHVFWLSCSICVILTLVARLQSDRYDYTWRTSLEDERAVKKFVDFFGAPMIKLGWSAPTERDVARLFVEREPRPAVSPTPSTADPSPQNDRNPSHATAPTQADSEAAESRARWSYFLLGLVFVWCVVPRAFLAAIYVLLTKRSLRDLKPKLDDPYFQGVLARAVKRRSAVVTEYAQEAGDIPLDEREAIAAPVDPIWHKSDVQAPVPSPPASPEPASSAGESAAEVEAAPEPEEPPRDATGLGEASGEESAPEPELAAEPKPTAEPAPAPEPEPAPEPKIDPIAALRERAAAEEARLLAKFTATAGFDDSALTCDPAPKPVSLVFGYDAVAPESTWREALGDARELVIFGDVADRKVLTQFTDWLDTNGSRVRLCAFATDVGYPPARHFARFMRDLLVPKLDAAAIYVVLTGGERLRLKFEKTPSAISERMEDWTNSIRFMSKASGLAMTLIDYYDADLDLPEPRARLSAALRDASTEASKPRQRARVLDKWDAASARILADVAAIFDSSDAPVNADSTRLLVAGTCDAIFKIYREETARVVDESSSRLFGGIGSEALGRMRNAFCVGTEAGKALAETAARKGLGANFIDARLAATVGLAERFRAISEKFSPKSALVAAAVGATAPALAAFAPLLGGAATAGALLTGLGALSSVLPASLASGAISGALGAFAPSALKSGKERLVALFRRKGAERGSDEGGAGQAGAASRESEAPVGADLTGDLTADTIASSAQVVERAGAASALALSSVAWCVTLELQGVPEEELSRSAALALGAFEREPLDSYDSISKGLSEVRNVLSTVPSYY